MLTQSQAMDCEFWYEGPDLVKEGTTFFRLCLV